MHRRGELVSIIEMDGSDASMLVLMLVKRWDLRTVGANLRPVSGGMRAHDGVGGSERVNFVCW